MGRSASKVAERGVLLRMRVAAELRMSVRLFIWYHPRDRDHHWRTGWSIHVQPALVRAGPSSPEHGLAVSSLYLSTRASAA